MRLVDVWNVKDGIEYIVQKDVSFSLSTAQMCIAYLMLWMDLCSVECMWEKLTILRSPVGRR